MANYEVPLTVDIGHNRSLHLEVSIRSVVMCLTGLLFVFISLFPCLLMRRTEFGWLKIESGGRLL